MKREDISNAVGGISSQFIQEAEDYEETAPSCVFKKKRLKIAIAAMIALFVMVGGASYLTIGRDTTTITAYAQGINEEITSAGIITNTGTINDEGVMEGHPLIFYLSGEDIATVRFSCKNQEIAFIDCTANQTEYEYAKNFTVNYHGEEREDSYMTIDWKPSETIRELMEHADSTIVALPEDLREDMIVMEITFGNGKTSTKAIHVSLQDDGTFLASFQDYEISDEDTFVSRQDSMAYYFLSESDQDIEDKQEAYVEYLSNHFTKVFMEKDEIQNADAVIGYDEESGQYSIELTLESSGDIENDKIEQYKDYLYDTFSDVTIVINGEKVKPTDNNSGNY